MKNFNYYLSLLLVKLLSILNKTKYLQKLENLVLYANGKSRVYYDLHFETEQCSKIIRFKIKDSTDRQEDDGVIIDIGANIGKFTSNLLKNFPKFKYYLFEPNKKLYTQLTQHFSKNNIKIFNFGLSDKNEEVEFYYNLKKHGLSSIFKRTHEINDNEKYNFEKGDKINLKRFDQLNLNIGNIIDLIKIDTEGSELKILHGIGDLLKKTKIIQFEFGRTHLDSKNSFYDFWTYLKKFNFDFYRIYPGGIRRIENYSWNEEIYIIQHNLH